MHVERVSQVRRVWRVEVCANVDPWVAECVKCDFVGHFEESETICALMCIWHAGCN